MFEDLVIEKPGVATRKTCPFCKSYAINKSEMKATLDGRFRQNAKCIKCGREWTIIYSEDKSTSWIQA
jgi:transposase-like protein